MHGCANVIIAYCFIAYCFASVLKVERIRIAENVRIITFGTPLETRGELRSMWWLAALLFDTTEEVIVTRKFQALR